MSNPLGNRVRICTLALFGLCVAATLHSPLARAQSDEIFANDFETPATLVLNEVNANIAGAQDLVELRATSDGSTLGIALIQDPSADGNGSVILATLPPVIVANGDLIVVHLNPAITLTEEIASKVSCSDSACYAGAWDERGGTTGITYSNRVLAVQAASGILTDAVPFSRSANTTSTFPAAVQYIQSLGLWLPADCNGSPCDYATTPSVVQIAADWTGLGTTPTGASVSRHATVDSNTSADWQVTASSTFGATNP